MANSVLLGITTFRKNEAAKTLIQSLIEHGYSEGNTILIADDGAGHARPVFEEFKGKVVYISGKNPQYGISVNKNRCIDYFLQNKHFDALLLLDDDIVFTAPGFIDHCKMVCKEDLKLPFVSSYWVDHNGVSTDDVLQTSGKTWTDDFPIKASTEWVNFHQGKHGHCLYFGRGAVEKAGFYNKMPGMYGMEHSLYFSRLLRIYGQCPELFPILKYPKLWYKGQCIPNNYDVPKNSIEINGKAHIKFLNEVYQGRGLYVGERGIKQKEKYEK
jgi:hypothetical protein